MRTYKLDGLIRAAAGATLLGLALAGCDKPAPQVAPPEPPAQVAPGIPDAPPTSDPAAPDAAPAPVPAPDSPPPTEPSPVPKPAASQEPSVDSMLAAIPSSNSKMGVGVDLRYSFEGAVLPNQPVIVNLAAVPRVGGLNLKVTVQEAKGFRLASVPLNVQKTNASGVYRQQFSLTKVSGTAEPLRVLVIAEAGESSAFGYFTIPLPPDDGTIAQKQESVKQR
jgi:hypothetical protein